jgi:hypothetical protein
MIRSVWSDRTKVTVIWSALRETDQPDRTKHGSTFMPLWLLKKLSHSRHTTSLRICNKDIRMIRWSRRQPVPRRYPVAATSSLAVA